VPQLGERVVRMSLRDADGKSVKASMRFHVADIARAVCSVGELNKRGFDVSFGPDGGSISRDGRTVPLLQVGNRFFLRCRLENARFEESAPVDDVLDDGDPEVSEQAVEGLPVPKRLSEAEVEEHRLSHGTFAPWCTHCVAGRARDNPHRRLTAERRLLAGEECVIQMDYHFYKEELTRETKERAMVTCLTAVVVETGLIFAGVAQTKGPGDRYLVAVVALFADQVGASRVALQVD